MSAIDPQPQVELLIDDDERCLDLHPPRRRSRRLTVEELEQTFQFQVSAGDLIVDLSAVEFVDSHGIHLVLWLADGVRACGHRFAVVCPESSVAHKALEITSLIGPLTVHPGREQALERNRPPLRSRASSSGRRHRRYLWRLATAGVVPCSCLPRFPCDLGGSLERQCESSLSTVDSAR